MARYSEHGVEIGGQRAETIIDAVTDAFGTNDVMAIVAVKKLRAAGYKIVGREPSEAMYMRGGNVAVSNRGDDHRQLRSGGRIGDMAAADAWRAMWDVA